MSDKKFSEFIDGGQLLTTDRVVGLRSGDNYIFSSSSIQPVNLSGTGDPNGSVAGVGGVNFYFDISTTDLWRCTVSGNSSTAVWNIIESAVTSIEYFRNATFTYYEDTGSVNAYVVSPVPSYTIIQSGTRVSVLCNSTNTSPSTLDIGFGPSNIIIGSSSGFVSLDSGEILNLGIYDFVYNGTEWILINPAKTFLENVLIDDIRNATFTYYVDSGTSNNYSVIPSPSYSTPQSGTRITVKISSDNTGDSTLTVNSFTSDIVVSTNSPFGFSFLEGGELKSSGIYDFVFNGTYWILLNPAITFDRPSLTGASVWMNTSQTIPGTNLPTLCNFDSINYDPDNLWDNINKRFVVKVPGYYRLNANIYVPNTSLNNLYIAVRKNSSYIYPGFRLSQVYTDGFNVGLSGVVTVIASSVGDYYDLLFFADSTAVTIGGPTTSGCRFQIKKITALL